MTNTLDQPTADIYADIAAGNLVCIRRATQLLGLNYATGRRRIIRDLELWPVRSRIYVRVSDLSNPCLMVP